jgi:hypothetical protein
MRINVSKGALSPMIEGRSIDGRYRCLADLAVIDGRLSITRLELAPWTFGGATIGTDALRQIPLGRWLTLAYSILQDETLWQQTGELGNTASGRSAAHKLAGLHRGAEPVRRGRPGYPAAFYRDVALRYLELQSQGVGRGVQQQIAEERSVPWPTVRDWLHKATVLGFLSPGSPGRAGRRPGPNLHTEEET